MNTERLSKMLALLFTAAFLVSCESMPLNYSRGKSWLMQLQVALSIVP
jgi:hypothetical protein